MKTFIRHIKTALAVFPIIAAVFFSGCGGGGGSATPSASPTYGISGTVSGAVQQGVTINLSGNSTATTTTDASGNYSFTGLSGTGNYTVTPAKTGYVFSSISSAVSMIGANVTGTNFTATANTAATYSISGKVSGHSPYIEMITLSGSMSGTTFTDWEGNYNFSGLVNGSYTVTPSFIGPAQSTGFSPSITTVSINSANVPNTNFTATYTLSGKVSGILSGVGLQGVTINLTGPVTANTTTDANGNYTISGLPIGDYTVVPSLSGYSFGPAGSVVSVYSGMARDFYATSAATTYSISGTVSGAILKNATITLSGANTGSVLTNANGNYTISGLVNGNYTVTPSLAGYKFSPANSAITINGANSTANNFVAAVSYRISGSVMGSGAALQGVTITLTGAANASTTTDMMGYYAFDGLANGSYSVTPSLAGYSFTPVSSAVTINGANSTGANIVSAVAPSTSIVLVLVNPLQNATVGQAFLQSVVQNITPLSLSPPATYTYSIDTLANGNGVPTGMTLDMAGVLSGTPFATGAADVNGYQIPHTYTFGVCATDTLTRLTTNPCPQTSITVLPLNITVTIAGTGSGTVTPSPVGNSCGANCYSGFASGSSVTLTATPATGSTFTGWSGACSGTGSCIVTMSTSKAVTATFNQTNATPSSVTPSSVTLGYAGSCTGGTLTGTFQVAAASNISWTATLDTNNIVLGGGTMSFSPISGSGSGTLTVTITVPPQLPSSSYSNCTLTYNLGTFDNVYVTFSDGTVVGVTVYWTFIGTT